MLEYDRYYIMKIILIYIYFDYLGLFYSLISEFIFIVFLLVNLIVTSKCHQKKPKNKNNLTTNSSK